MSKKVFVINQSLSDARYTWDWYAEMYRLSEFYLLGDMYIETIDRNKEYNYFAGLERAIRYETEQINKIMRFEKIDKLLITDIDFPGLAVSAIPLFRLKFPNIKIFSIMHAGSYTNGDIFSKIVGKNHQEQSIFDLCDVVFVATDYHKHRLLSYFDIKNDNIVVTDGFYFNSEYLYDYKEEPKEKDILLLGRKEQFVKLEIDEFNPDEHTTLISRRDYLKKLCKYKIVVVSKCDDMFGYSPLEALSVGSIPLVPDSFGYKETLTDKFRFKDIFELKEKIRDILKDDSSWKKEAEKIDLLKYKYRFEEMLKFIKEY